VADRESVGYLPQGHPVFSGTIADNVTLTDPPVDSDTGDGSRLAEALAVAGLHGGSGSRRAAQPPP